MDQASEETNRWVERREQVAAGGLTDRVRTRTRSTPVIRYRTRPLRAPCSPYHHRTSRRSGRDPCWMPPCTSRCCRRVLLSTPAAADGVVVELHLRNGGKFRQRKAPTWPSWAAIMRRYGLCCLGRRTSRLRCQLRHRAHTPAEKSSSLPDLLSLQQVDGRRRHLPLQLRL